MVSSEAPLHGSNVPIRRPTILDHDTDPFPLSTHGSGALVTLIRNRSTNSLNHHRRHMSWNPDQDDEEAAIAPPPFRFRERSFDDDETPRLAADELRLSQIIAGPEMRSMRLIGNSNPRYQWERYWKTDEQLSKMPAPM